MTAVLRHDMRRDPIFVRGRNNDQIKGGLLGYRKLVLALDDHRAN
jgi:hypothetical protein